MSNKQFKEVLGSSLAVMPDHRLAPTVLTETEAIRFLRIQDYKNPHLTLRHYREQGKLKATRIGRKLFYTSAELLRFLEAQTGENGK